MRSECCEPEQAGFRRAPRSRRCFSPEGLAVTGARREGAGPRDRDGHGQGQPCQLGGLQGLNES